MNHKQILHSKDPRYDCRECGRYFSSMEEMRSHLKKMHAYRRDEGGADPEGSDGLD